MVAKAETALDELQARVRPLEEAMARVERRLDELQGQLRAVRERLAAVEARALDLGRDMRHQRHALNELRQKLKKHDALLREIDPERAPREYERLVQDREDLRVKLERAGQALETLHAQYEQALEEELRLLGEEWELEQELDHLRARYETLLKRIARLAQGLERRVRDARARHF